MNQPTNNVENLTTKLKSVEPKFALKSKTIWGLILLVGLVLSIIFDLNPEEAMTKAEKLVGLLGGILTVLGIRTKSQPLTFKTKIPEGTTNLLLMGVMGISMAAVGVLSSCTPSAYQVNTLPYSKQIEANPESVVVQPEHVTEVGGFQAEFGARVLTDQGEIDISDGGVSGDVVIDLRSGK